MCQVNYIVVDQCKVDIIYRYFTGFYFGVYDSGYLLLQQLIGCLLQLDVNAQVDIIAGNRIFLAYYLVYLADIDQQAEEMFERLVKQMAAAEGVTEQLKAADQITWVDKMNNIRNQASEIININLILN